MRKIAVLTSLLALTACGGGSGGGHSGNVVPGGKPSDVFIPDNHPETSDLTITSLPDSVNITSQRLYLMQRPHWGIFLLPNQNRPRFLINVQ